MANIRESWENEGKYLKNFMIVSFFFLFLLINADGAYI